VEEVAVKFLKRWKYSLTAAALVVAALYLWLGAGYRWAAGLLVVMGLSFAQGFVRAVAHDWREMVEGPLPPQTQKIVDHWLASGWEPERCRLLRCRRLYPHTHLRRADGYLVIGGGV
jgi:hypothetical protein